MVSLNGHSETWSYNNFAPDDPMVRSGDSGFYQWAAFQFPESDLNAAGSLDQFTFGVSSHADGVMYDALRMEITNTSAAPSTTGWYDYTYVTSSDTAPVDSFGLTATNAYSPLSATWSAAGGGAWGGSTNWFSLTIPAVAQTSATFGSSITTALTVTLNTVWTVGSITFDNTNSYTIAAGSNGMGGGGAITLDNGSSTAAITDLSGTHFIAATITLNSNLLLTVANAGDAVSISGAIGGNGGLATAGNGTVTLTRLTRIRDRRRWAAGYWR